ncbi:MAG: hypothetical protein CL876_06615 [Dehalococcoidales bacterium]|nr:hypothetical protein [Dehalococcoidales bacterium]
MISIAEHQPKTESRQLLWTPSELTDLPDLEWTWEHWLPKGEVVLLAAKQGSGKSTLTYQISQAVADGEQLPDGSYADRGNVLYFDLEASPEAAGKRFRELGVKSESVHCCFLDGLPEGASRLEFFLFLVKNGQYDLAVIDSYRGLRVGDEMRADQTRETLDQLVAVAHEFSTTILIVHHLNKQSSSKDELDRVSGSSDLTARPRIVWLMNREGRERTLKVAKSNLGPEPEPIKFEMEDGRLIPIEQPNAVSAIEDACSFLQSMLANGPVPAQQATPAAIKHGISKRTLERAKRLMRVNSERRSDGWVWTR